MEREVLLLLRRLHAEEGSVTRERLTVIGRGRGLEIARSLLLLKSMGLVEVIEKRPSFWRRLFGAKAQEILVPAPERDAPPQEDPAELAEAPFAEDHSGQSAEYAPQAPTSEAEPTVHAELEAPQQDAYAPIESASTPTAEARVAEASTSYAAAPYAPEAEPPAPQPAQAPLPEPEPLNEAPLPVEPAPAALVARPPRPAPVPQGYTDELGGAPAEFTLAPRLDPALVEGMRDFLAGMGLELTFAGEAMAAQRLQQGAVIGDVVGELVVFALAHAAHHETLSGIACSQEDLSDYAQAILEELERLAEAGEITRAAFEEQKSVILQLTDREAAREALVAALLADPVGGMAPPALLPEELRGIEDGGDGFLQNN